MLSFARRLAPYILGAYAVILIVSTATDFYPYEDVAFFFDDSPERAYAYALKHFSALDAREYDIDRAEFFYLEAAKRNLDVGYPYHELARIAFLRGDFERALALIKLQIVLHGDSMPNSYYIRGLILGFMERYDEAALSFEKFLKFHPTNWAAMNDYAWVLLKAGRAKEARLITEKALEYFPNNVWVLNSNAIAAFEMGDTAGALESASKAAQFIDTVGVEDWLRAYPGNDPNIAHEGITALRGSILKNMHMLRAASAKDAVE